MSREAGIRETGGVIVHNVGSNDRGIDRQAILNKDTRPEVTPVVETAQPLEREIPTEARGAETDINGHVEAAHTLIDGQEPQTTVKPLRMIDTEEGRAMARVFFPTAGAAILTCVAQLIAPNQVVLVAGMGLSLAWLIGRGIWEVSMEEKRRGRKI